ncbi:GNAT family N-acetyltransferase [Croceivirga thetidis]|uniref:GNAT family N-acetyltransferase n=1 Tax=Croceivirga thetidis TaxID=2721623 RepID=UPI001B2FF2EB|nr:GNAT family N-acetyltransferase [Croceivirga thetidis]
MNYTSFETERLIIRPTSEEDAVFVYHLMNTPKWLKYIGDRNVKSVATAKQYINKKMRPQLHRLGYSNFTVIKKADNQKIGTCGLFDREGLEGIDLGFAFLPAFEKKGFAFESSERLIRAAFENYEIKTLSAITAKDNISSQKLLQRLEFNLIGTTKIVNDPNEILLYQLDNMNSDDI